MGELVISLLGPLRITYGGASLLPFRTVKGPALLAYLAVAGAMEKGAATPRELLMELLWPGMPERSTRQNLRQTLYLLRQALPAVPAASGRGNVEFLVASRRAILVNPAAQYHVDVQAFVAALRQQTRSALEAALALYRGDFLADFYLGDSNEFEAWAADYRARFREMAWDAHACLAQAYEANGEFGNLERMARQWEALDPLAEQPQRALLLGRASSGKWAAAASGYETYVARLQDELQIVPPQALTMLYDEVRSRQGRLAVGKAAGESCELAPDNRASTRQMQAWKTAFPGRP